MKKHKIQITLTEPQYQVLLKFSGGEKKKCSTNLKLAVNKFLTGITDLMKAVELEQAAERCRALDGVVRVIKGEQ